MHMRRTAEDNGLYIGWTTKISLMIRFLSNAWIAWWPSTSTYFLWKWKLTQYGSKRFSKQIVCLFRTPFFKKDQNKGHKIKKVLQDHVFATKGCVSYSLFFMSYIKFHAMHNIKSFGQGSRSKAFARCSPHFTKGFYLPMTGGDRGTGVTQSSASSLALLAISSCCSLRPWSSSSSSSSATLFSRNFDNADNSSFKPLVLKWKEGWGRFQIRQYKVYKIIWKGNINS